MNKKILTAVVAGLVMSSAMAIADEGGTMGGGDDKQFSCEGGNTCKAKGECGGKGHSCGGKNKCKGQGMIFTKDQAECDAAIAKVKAAKPNKPNKPTPGKKHA